MGPQREEIEQLQDELTSLKDKVFRGTNLTPLKKKHI